MIGVHDNYTCFTSSSIRYTHRLIQGALDAQAVSVSDINMTKDSGMKSTSKWCNVSIKQDYIVSEHHS